MSDLIRRSELLTLIAAKLSDNKVTHRIRAVNRLIKSMPTVDAVEVVRCKDCARREVCRTSTVWAVPPNDNWFCADGERKKVSE